MVKALPIMRRYSHITFLPPLIPNSAMRFTSFIPHVRHTVYLPLSVRKVRIFCTQRSRTQTYSSLSSHSQPKVTCPLRTPYHLVHFRRSRFVAHLNEHSLRKTLPPTALPDPPTRMEVALKSAGQAHEETVVTHLLSLMSHADPLVEIPYAHPDRFKLTHAAIRSHTPLVRGAALRDDLYAGYVDLLIRSADDPFLTPAQREMAHPEAYSVCEIKLASLQTTDFALQTAAYTAMLHRLQAPNAVPPPTHSYLWLGDPSNAPSVLPFRVLKYLFQRTSNDYIAFLSAFERGLPIPLPDAPLDVLSPWRSFAKQVLKEQDSLGLVAGIRRSQVTDIVTATGLTTLADFATLETSHMDHLITKRALNPVHRRLHRQACMQYATRQSGKTAFEVLRSTGPGMRLPRPSERDIYFDMEGFPLMQEGGLEYLFGVCTKAGKFKAWWAHTRAQEEKAFISLIRWLCNTLEMSEVRPHVFHYGHYEVTALRRVGMRAVTEEGIEASSAFEKLVEDGIFFDVYKFVKGAVVIGENSYSIKNVEKLVNISREGSDLADAESSVGMYYEWRRTCFTDTGPTAIGPTNASHPILEEILHYNRQDCESLAKVVDWLRVNVPMKEELDFSDVSSESEVEKDITSKDKLCNEPEILPGACGRSYENKMSDSVAISRSSELSKEILHIKTDRLQENAVRNLSHLLHFYVRESTPVRRAFMERVETASSSMYEDLFEDDKCLTGVRLDGTFLSEDGKKRLFTYSFNNNQPSGLRGEESVAFVVPQRDLSKNTNEDISSSIWCFMTIKGIDRLVSENNGKIMLSGGNKEHFVPPRYGVLVSSEDLKICDAPLRQSILRKAEQFSQDKTDKTISLAGAFLNRTSIFEECFPGKVNEIFCSELSLREDISSFLSSRKHSCAFVIQGPPGSGKTSLSSNIIYDLVTKHGKTIAVSSNSHSAIDNLLHKSAKAGVDERAIFKVGTRCLQNSSVQFKANIRDVSVAPLREKDKLGVEKQDLILPQNGRKGRKTKRKEKASLVGATCYQLCREACEDKFDFLFIDEASQVTVANFLAMSSCAKYAILVGDQQQLEMPIKGAHPGDVGLSCLSYIVGRGEATVSRFHGIFLQQSYRMNPKICSFISDTFYDNALHAAQKCATNEIHLNASKESGLLSSGSGITFLPCDSFVPTNENVSSNFVGKWHRPAEVEILSKVVDELVGASATIGTADRILDVNDILVVAPYNAQVRALRAALPLGIRVGTVDKFQGQEAAVVLVSTCAGDVSDQISVDETGLKSSWMDDSIDNGYFDEEETLSHPERRGLRFSLHKNRINVAISRAQCLAVVTGQSDACSRMRLDNFEDVSMAAMFEYLQSGE